MCRIQGAGSLWTAKMINMSTCVDPRVWPRSEGSTPALTGPPGSLRTSWRVHSRSLGSTMQYRAACPVCDPTWRPNIGVPLLTINKWMFMREILGSSYHEEPLILSDSSFVRACGPGTLRKWKRECGVKSLWNPVTSKWGHRERGFPEWQTLGNPSFYQPVLPEEATCFSFQCFQQAPTDQHSLCLPFWWPPDSPSGVPTHMHSVLALHNVEIEPNPKACPLHFSSYSGRAVMLEVRCPR